MKKVFITILTLAVLGGGYVGAKAFEKEVMVRLADEEGWYPVDESGHRLSESPIPNFNPNTDCEPADQNCAGRFEIDDSTGELKNTPEELADGVYQQ